MSPSDRDGASVVGGGGGIPSGAAVGGAGAGGCEGIGGSVGCSGGKLGDGDLCSCKFRSQSAASSYEEKPLQIQS